MRYRLSDLLWRPKIELNKHLHVKLTLAGPNALTNLLRIRPPPPEELTSEAGSPFLSFILA